MRNPRENLLPLGDFKPADQWQTWVNSLFYGTLGPAIHDHFQTYVSRDYRLAHSLAEDFFSRFAKLPAQDGKIFIQEWGVGNGNLAACFLSHLKKIDTDGRVYPHTHYILCDYSQEILRGVRGNPQLQSHSGHFSTVQMDAEQPACFRLRSIHNIISNEIWDDLATKVLIKNDGSLYEEYLQPLLDPSIPDMDFEEFTQIFNRGDFSKLKECPPFLSNIIWEKSYQRVDIDDWPYAEVIEAHLQQLEDEIPTPINIGAFATLERAHYLLGDSHGGYSGFDYGMLSFNDLNLVGRPYFKLYGGQYTFMVNFPLLHDVGKAIGFESVHTESQHDFVGRHLEDKVLSTLEIVQAHPQISRMTPWDADILMLSTLQTLNGNYRSHYKRKMEYPVMPDTPKKQRKKIAELVQKMNPFGVPDTVAYVTREEVFSVLKQLLRLGYRERDLQHAFHGSDQPIRFIHIHFQ